MDIVLGVAVARAPDGAGRIDLAALAAALRDGDGRPTIVCLQAGELNTGALDPRGMRVMRVLVCNRLTTGDDVDRAVAAVWEAPAEA